MSANTLLVKNMVCNRCVTAVEDILNLESIPFQKVVISQISLDGQLTEEQKERLTKRFNKIGFELIDNRNGALIEKIKQLVIRRARNEVNEKDKQLKLSHYISCQMNYEYTYLSSLFSPVEGRTIEKYFIDHRIEKVKELLIYGETTLSQIAFDMDYSSVAHLSNQFKKVTGLTPSYFKEIGMLKRKSLDKI